MFHFLEHAFFKALLFLAVGIVIHALAGEQSLDRMGGLGRHLRFAYAAVAIGCLAIAGFPGFSGFFSKDAILAGALADGTLGKVLWVVGTLTAGITALYMFRMLFRAFGGPEPEGGYAHTPHPSGLLMTLPVGILAVLSVIGGWIQFSPWWHPVETWLQTVAEPVVSPRSWQEWLSIALSLALGLSGIALAWLIYGVRRVAVPRVAFAHRTLERKFWFDESYDALFYAPAVFLAGLLRRGVEQPLIADSGRDLGDDTRDLGGLVARAQTGLLRTYALAIASSVAVLAVVFVAVK
jgi:NADH-quinone oxidoreductase subunit L